MATRYIAIDIKGNASSAKQAIGDTEKAAKGLQNSFDQVDKAALKNIRSMDQMGAVGSGAMRSIVQGAQDALRQIPLIGPALASGVGKAFSTMESDAKRSLNEIKRAQEQVVALFQRNVNRHTPSGQTPTPVNASHLNEITQAYNSLTTATDKADFAAEVFGKDAAKGTAALEALGGGASGAAGEVAGLTGRIGAFIGSIGPAGAAVIAAGIVIVGFTAVLALAAYAIYQTGLKMNGLSQEWAEFATTVANDSERLRVSAETFSSLGAAAERAGLKSADGAGFLRDYNQAVRQAADGNAKMQASLRTLGIDWVKAIKDPDQELTHFIDNYRRLPDSVEKSTALMRVFGDRAADVDRIIEQTNGNFEEFKRQMVAAGIAIDDVSAQKARAFTESAARMNQAIASVAHVFGEEFAPVAIRVMNWVTGYLEANRENWKYWAEGLTGFINGVINVIDGLVGALRALRETGNVAVSVAVMYTLMTRGDTSMGAKAGANWGDGGVGTDEAKRNAAADWVNRFSEFTYRRAEQGRALARQRGGRGAGANAKPADLTNQFAALDVKDAERLYRQLTDTIKRNYAERRVDMQQYVDQMIAEETRLKERQVGIIYEKMEAATRITDKGKQDLEMRTLNEQFMAVSEDTEKKIEQIREAARQKNMANVEADQRLSVDLLKESGKVRLAQIADELERGLILREDAAKQTLAIELTELEFKKSQLETQLALQKGHREAEDEINRQLAVLAGQRQVAERLGALKIAGGRREDIAAADALRRQGKDAFEAMRDQLLGDRAPKLTHAQTLELALQTEAYKNLLDVERDQLRSLAELADAQEAYNKTFRGKLEAFFKSIPSYKDALSESLLGAFNSLGDALGRALTTWENGFKGFFDRIKDAFKQTAQQMLAEMAKLTILKGFARLLGFGGGADRATGDGGPGGGGDFPSGGSGGGDSWFDGIRNLFGGGGRGVPLGGNGGGILNAVRGGGGGAGGRVGGWLGRLGGFLGLGGAAGGSAAAGGVTSAEYLAAWGLPSAAGGGGAAAGGAAAGGGGSLLGSMGALFTNPWTAVVAGGIIGGVLLWRHFRHGTEKKLREAIKSTYGVDIKDMKLLTQIKQIGEQAFGRGNVGKHLMETIKLDAAKELILNYAESTGQDAKGLVTERQLKDPAYSGNRFIRESGSSLPLPSGDGGQGTGSSSGSGSGPTARGGSGGGGAPAVVYAAMVGAIGALTKEVQRLKAMPAGHVVGVGLQENPAAAGDAVITVANDDWRFNDRLANKNGSKS